VLDYYDMCNRTFSTTHSLTLAHRNYIQRESCKDKYGALSTPQFRRTLIGRSFHTVNLALCTQRLKMPRKIARDLRVLEPISYVRLQVTQFAAAVVAHAGKFMRQDALFREQCRNPVR
jgi:hypothetical protein